MANGPTELLGLLVPSAEIVVKVLMAQQFCGQTDLKTAIRASYLADGLNDGHLAELSNIAESRIFEAGDEIVRQYDLSRDLMILVSGIARVLTVMGEPIGWIKPGMPIGEVSLLDDKPRSSTVVAFETCVVVLFPARPLMSLLTGSPEMASRCLLNISRVLCARLRSANQNIAALMAIDECQSSR